MANAAPLRDGKAEAARRKRERKSAHRDKAFTAWVHTQPCCVCGKYGVEQHHQPYRSSPDWHDTLSVPLCSLHHRGGTGIHLMGKERFENEHGICLASVIETLNRRYKGE